MAHHDGLPYAMKDGKELRDKMADYATPSLVGTDAVAEPDNDAQTELQIARRMHQNAHRILDEAGIDVGGNFIDRVLALIGQRDNLAMALNERDHQDANGEVTVPEDGSPSYLTGSDDPHWNLKVALTNWWIDLAHEEVDRVVPKAAEYGSTDLMEVGRQLANVMGWDRLNHEEHTELGIYFYLLGKLARWTDAVRERRRPSDDTLHDIGVYVRMGQRNRAVGGWPVGDKEE